MRILITGASGFIGSNFIKHSGDKYEFISLGRTKPELVAMHQFLDFESPTELDFSRVPADIDMVIHFAQGDGHNEFPNSADKLFMTNIFGIFRILRMAQERQIPRVLIASSGSVYQLPNILDPKLNGFESSPVNFYSTSKLASEYLSLSFSADIDIRIMRIFFPYGFGISEKFLIPTIVNRIQHRVPIQLDSTEQGLVFNPIYIRDFCNFLAYSIDNNFISWDKKSIIDVAGPEIIDLKTFALIVGEKLSINPFFEYGAKLNKIIGNSEMIKKTAINLTPFSVGIESIIKQF